MRFFPLAVLATVAFGAAPVGATRVGPRPIVILVHGRGQLGQDTAQLRREWKRDLDSSLKLVGFPALRDEDIRLAWYADVLDPESDTFCGGRNVEGDSLGFGDVARGFLALLSGAADDDDSREVRGVMGDLMYALDDARRCAAERRVGGVIDAALSEQRPVIVVAYSLGSLVTYGYLKARPDSLPGHVRLVTVGSPLGLRLIREMVFGETSARLRLPASVASVENVYDPNDFLSGPLEGVLSAPVRDDATHASDAVDSHNLGRYLRDPATGGAVMRALCASSAGELRGCARR